MRYYRLMRTTVDLRPHVLAELKAIAARQKTTLGQVIEKLLEGHKGESQVEEIDGMPVLRPKRPGEKLTSEEVYRLLEEW
jgi:hypothetical protein